jgi:hypothetical protein
MALDAVGKLVASHATSPVETQKKIERNETEQVIVRRMFSWIMWGMIIIGIGVMMLVMNKYFDLPRWLHIASSFLLLGGVGVTSAGLLNGIRQGTQLSGKRTTTPALPAVEQTAMPTNPFPESLPSVTERTTKLISNTPTVARGGKESSLD